MEILAPFLNQTCLWIFASLMIVAAWSDAMDFTIPNRIIVGLLVLYPAYVMTTTVPVDWLMAVAISSGILALGMGLYAVGTVGAGDIKLIAATALWAGPEHTLDFVLLTALAGGVVSLALLVRFNYGWGSWGVLRPKAPRSKFPTALRSRQRVCLSQPNL